MMNLQSLTNSSRGRKPTKRLGRGTGSKLGKTCGRGQKGQGARAGSKRRLGYEGGQFRLYMKLPIRGFSNFLFRKKFSTINLEQIDKMFNDGDVVSVQTLKEHGYLKNVKLPVKILGKGKLTKKVTFEVDAISDGAREKLTAAKIPFTLKS